MKKKHPAVRDSRRRSLENLEPRQLLAGDLVAHWVAQDLIGSATEGATPAVWTDRVASIPASATGGPLFVAAAGGGRAALRFNASDGADWFKVAPADNPMASAGDFSVIAVFETDSTTLRDGANWFNQTGIVDSNRIGFAADWGMAIDRAGKITAGVSPGGFGTPSNNLSSSETGLNDGAQHTVVFTRAGGTLGLSIDGGAAQTLAGASNTPRDASVDLVIGGLLDGNAAGAFTGDISEVRIYDGALSTAEINAVNAEITGFYNNRPPAPVADRYTLPEDSLLFTTTANGVLANDTDSDGDALTAVLVTNVQHGTLTLQPTGVFVYAPALNFTGVDSFTYAARDFRNSEPVQVTLNVTPVYDAALTQPDLYRGRPTGILAVSGLVGVLANDTNIDGGPITAQLVQNVSDGSLTLNSDGAFNYNPQGFAGTTSFQYRVADGTGFSAAETVTLILNTPPIAVADQFTLNEDQPLSLTAAAGILGNDTDADGDALIVEVVETTKNGQLAMAPDGSLTYTPNVDFVGGDTFSYRLLDGNDASSTVPVQLTVLAVNDPPVAVSDVYFGDADTTLTVSAAQGVLDNDSDVDSGTLTATLVSPPATGQVTLNRDGSFTYVPAAGFTGTATFSYRSSDGSASSGITAVNVFVGESPLRISEIMAANVDAEGAIETRTRVTVDDSFSGDREHADWIEIQNLASSPFDLSGYYLSNDPRVPKQWQFPAGTIVPASGYLLVFASDIGVTDPELDENGILHADFKLSLNPEYVSLTTPIGGLLDAIDYPDQYPGVTYGITADGSLGYLVEPSPVLANSAAYLGLTPDTAFSVDRGFYTDPVTVEITTDVPGFEIRYTFDGSIPSATNGTVYAAPILVDRTTTLRAATIREGYLTTDVDTQTYLFLDQIITQSETPTTGPSASAVALPPDWRGIDADYELDPDVTTDPQYASKMKAAFEALPSLSVALPMENIFGRTGLYSNPLQETEQATSAELMFPDGSAGFQIDAGLRMQGGASRNTEHGKHSFSLRFREDYGAGQLDYPLFEGSPVSSFDSIHLRARYNNSWIHRDQGQRNRASMIRETWMRESMLAAGEVAAGHGRFVHLYLNGVYWGVYEMHERQDANHFANYYGGQAHEYQATNADVGVDGVVRQPHAALVETVESLDWDQIQRVLDVDNQIRYTILNQYGGNQDVKSDGNWRSAGGGTAEAPWQFFVWDAERTLENVNQRSGTVPVADLLGLMRDLLQVEEYRMKFADTIHELLYNDGALTPESASTRWMALANTLEVPLIAESARWGDFKQSTPLTVNNEWIAERDRLVTEYFPLRTAIVIDNFRTRNNLFFPPRNGALGSDVYPVTDAAEFLVGGSRQHGGFLDGRPLTIMNPNGNAGIVYYTLDGSDPRLVGGALNPNAVQYGGGPIALAGSTVVRTRVFNADEWSAMSQAEFTVEQPANATNLRISEINYNPLAARAGQGEPNVSDSEFEFIELRNVSANAINLKGVQFVHVNVDGNAEGITYRFGAQSLAAGEKTIVVRNRDVFKTRYGSVADASFAQRADEIGPVGQWEGGGLSNGGERITLVDSAGTLIHQVDYRDAGIWPERADGFGSTLELIDAAADPNAGTNWRASYAVNGTPGSDPLRATTTVVINELLTNSNAPLVDQVELYSRGGAVDLGGWTLTDDVDRLARYMFPAGTMIPAGGYLVVDQSQFGFGLKGQDSDDLYLLTPGAVGFADSVSFGATEADTTIGRWPNGSGDLFPQSVRSIGTANSGPLTPQIVISEVHYHGGTLANGETNETVEFVEIWNTTGAPVDLAGWRVDKAIDYVIPAGRTVPANSGITLVSFDPVTQPAALSAFRQATGLPNNAILLGPYRGTLDNGGENLELQRPAAAGGNGFTLVDRVRYDDVAPWPVAADGAGSSLQRLGGSFGNAAASWIAAVPTPGIDNLGGIDPGAFDLTGDGLLNAADIDRLCVFLAGGNLAGDVDDSGTVNSDDLLSLLRFGLRTGPGDANLDGVFNSSDLVSVFVVGEYEDGIAGNSTWSDGDWNCDGDFNTSDLVSAFSLGTYSNAAVVALHDAVDVPNSTPTRLLDAAIVRAFGASLRSDAPYDFSSQLDHVRSWHESRTAAAPADAARFAALAADELFAAESLFDDPQFGIEKLAAAECSASAQKENASRPDLAEEPIRARYPAPRTTS